MKRLLFMIVIITLFFIQGCATYSQFTSIPEQAKITIGKTNISGTSPLGGDVGRTTFGKYPVKVQKEGYDTLYSMLPLYVNGGVIALDAIFFAPAAFFNVAGPFPFYEFDLERKIILYKKKADNNWKEYIIPEGEKIQSRAFFGD